MRINIFPVKMDTHNHQEEKDLTLQQYLKEICKLQKENNNLLSEIRNIEQKRERQKKWNILGKVLMILFPYILSIGAIWYFYYQIQTTIHSLEQKIEDLTPDLNFEIDTQSLKEKYWEESSLKKIFSNEK